MIETGAGERVWTSEKGKRVGKKKKTNLRETLLLAVPKHKTLLVKYNLTVIKPKIFCFNALWRKKSFCNTTRGRK